MLDNTLSKVVYVADGIQKQWDIPFEFYKIEDVHIYITSDGEHIEEIDQNYYYDEEGKFFIYPTEESELDPIPAGTQVLILRETENTQLEDSSEIYFKSKDIERGLDNLTMQVQDLKRDSLRAVKLSHFATQTPEDFAKGIFEAERLATEAAAKAATSESNASLSEQNAASSASSAQTASATATAAAQLAESLKSDTEELTRRAETAAADASVYATQASESAHMASDLLQEVSNSIYNKEQVDEKVSKLEGDIALVEEDVTLIEGLIPNTASSSNQLVTKQELLNEEMDIREDLNEGLSELQTQITAQASAIAGKQDKLVAGANITINGNVISATGGGGGGGSAGSADIAKAIENQNKSTDTIDPIYNWLGTKQEYEEQNVAQEHPDWVCFITDDMGEQGGGGGGSSEAVWGAIAGDINSQKDLTNLLSNTENKIRADVNTADSELQAQITAQATAIDRKQDKLTAGEGVTIEGNVISATVGGSAELPDNVYTQENLLGGKDIEIIPEPVEGGIDEYTWACWHFDGSLLDEVSGIAASSNSAVLNTDYVKFGSGSMNGGPQDKKPPFTFNEKTSFSFDFWAFIGLPNSSSFASLGACGIYGNRGFTNWFHLNNGAAGSALPVYLNGVNTTTDFIVPRGVWTHYYAGYDAKTFTYFAYANGKKFFEKKDETPFSEDLISIGTSGSGVSRYDEVRFSKGIRWTEDFEPPTQPYRKAEPTGNYVINFTGKASSSSGASKNIGEVYYSQSSLASDNAGALPLFTGETIASANTIYPDFYAWVEKHPELTINSTGYQHLLDKYGECPLYCLEQVASEESRIVYSYNFTDLKQNCLDTLDYVYGYFDGNSFVKVDKNSEYGLFYTAEQMSDTGTINKYPVYLDSGLTKRLYGYAKSNLDDDYKYRPLFLSLNVESSYIGFSIFVGEDEQTERRFGDAWIVAPSTITSTQGSEIAKFYSYTKDGSLRLPKLANYIKMANTAEGITQSEAGLPNITGSLVCNSNDFSGAIYSDSSVSGGSYYSAVNNPLVKFDASRSSAVYGNSDTVTPAHTTLYPWVYAFSSAIPASTAQAAAFQEGLSGKADSDLGNIPTNYDYVVESYSDEEGNWYRVYKSGWLEQGGAFTTTSTTNATSYKVNLLKPMSNSFYYVSVRPVGHTSYFGDDWTVVGERTTTTFNTSTPNGGCVWYACGQGA